MARFREGQAVRTSDRSVTVTARIDAELAKRLHREAQRRGVSPAFLVRDLIGEHLSREKEDE